MIDWEGVKGYQPRASRQPERSRAVCSPLHMTTCYESESSHLGHVMTPEQAPLSKWTFEHTVNPQITATNQVQLKH